MDWQKSNIEMLYKRPVLRSRFRVMLGKSVYTLMRWGLWHGGQVKYAACKTKKDLRYSIVNHETPTLRALKNVDMWLQHNKVHNLKLAVPRIDGIMLYPGETFSYWKLIGMPHRFKGYKQGVVLERGRPKAGIGGGLCQLSNLIFWLTIHTPLTITERYRHSYDVFPDQNRTQPFGSGATCVYNYRDLQIKNETAYVWRLKLEVTDTALKGQWQSEVNLNERYEIVEKDHRIETNPWGGYVRRNRLFRNVWSTEGRLLDQEWVCDNYGHLMYEPLLSSCI